MFTGTAQSWIIKDFRQPVSLLGIKLNAHIDGQITLKPPVNFAGLFVSSRFYERKSVRIVCSVVEKKDSDLPQVGKSTSLGC